MQLLTSFKKSVHRVQSHLKVIKLKGGSEAYVQIFLKLCQKLRLIMFIKIWYYKKPKNKGFFACHTVAMVSYCVTKMITTCSPRIRLCLDTTIVAFQTSCYSVPCRAKSKNGIRLKHRCYTAFETTQFGRLDYVRHDYLGPQAFAVQHDSSATFLQTACFCRVELNS